MPAAEQLADHAHPVQQLLVDDGERVVALHRLVEVRLDPAPVAIDDARLQPLFDGQLRAVDLRRLLALDALEQGDEVRQRVVPAFAVFVRGPRRS